MAEDRPNDHDREEIRKAAPPVGVEVDPAAKSLADALRVSFRLLTGIMILVVVAFLLTGLKSIEPQQIGVKKVFGKVVGAAEQGLAYTWPFPVGEIEIVTTRERTATVEDFWMNETPADKTKKLTDRRTRTAGLRPGWDGALLTGDRNLLHVKLICLYAIQGPQGALAYLRNIDKENLETTVRAAVCQAAIAAAARRTADGIQRKEKSQFAQDVRKEAQRLLDVLTEVDGRPYQAIKINAIILANSTWPLRALPAYLKAQKAISKREELRNQAISDARDILNAAAGASYEMLVGRPEDFIGPARAGGDDGDRPYDLIGQYSRQSDPAKARQLLERIERVLMSNTTGGQASRIIADAKAYKTRLIQSAEARAKRFNDLLAQYQQTPQFMLERHWADVRDEILNSPTVEKVYLNVSGQQKTVYRVSRPQEVAKRIRRELLKMRKAEKSKSGSP